MHLTLRKVGGKNRRFTKADFERMVHEAQSVRQAAENSRKKIDSKFPPVGDPSSSPTPPEALHDCDATEGGLINVKFDYGYQVRWNSKSKPLRCAYGKLYGR